MLVLYHCHMFLLSYYIILRNFIGQTIEKMLSASFLFLLQKVTSGNIIGTGQKFTGIFYRTNEDRSPKDSSRGPQRPGAAPGGGLGPIRGWDPPLPCGAPLGRLRRL